METINRAQMELMDRGLSQKIIDRHANLPLFTTPFSPVLSTKRISPHTRWLELVYALPLYMILRRNIVRSFTRTKNVFAAAKRILNIFVHFSIPSGRSDFFAALFRYYSYNPLLFLSQTTAPVKPQDVSFFPHYLSTTEPAKIGESHSASGFVISAVDNTIPQNVLYRPYGRLERETFHNEQKIITYVESSSPPGLVPPIRDETSGMGTEEYMAAANFRLPAVSTSPPTVSHKPTAVSYKSLFLHYLSATEHTEMSESRPTSGFAISAVDNYTIPQNVLYRPHGRLERYKTQAAYAQPHSTSGSPVTLFSYYTHSPLLLLSRKTAPVKSQSVSLVPHYLSATEHTEIGESRPSSGFAISAVDNSLPQSVLYLPYGRLERETIHNGQRIITYVESSSPPGRVPPVRDETHGTGTEVYSAAANFRLPTVSTLPPTVSHKPSAVSYKTQASHDPLLFLSRETASAKSQGVSLVPHYLSATEIDERRPSSVFAIPAVDNYTIPQNVHHRPYGRLERESYSLHSTNDFINFATLNSMNNNQRQHTPEMKKAESIYHTHPEIEHVTTTRVEIIKERVVEKEEESKPPHAALQLPSIDVNRLTDQIYQMMERKIRIEKERRGLYG